MRTNIEIDEALMAEAMQSSGIKTKREVVHEALAQFVRLKRQREAFLALRGIGWEGDLDAMRIDRPLPSFE